MNKEGIEVQFRELLMIELEERLKPIVPMLMTQPNHAPVNMAVSAKAKENVMAITTGLFTRRGWRLLTVLGVAIPTQRVSGRR